jgi:hypothetical protein
MAKVSAGKDGSYPQHVIALGRRVPLDDFERRLRGRDLRDLSPMPPAFHPAPPSHAARHAVVAREMDEPPGQFLTQAGYDLLPEVSPDEAEALIVPPASRGPCQLKGDVCRSRSPSQALRSCRGHC